LQPRRSISKRFASEKRPDNMKSISDIRGSIRSLRQRLDSTLIQDEPNFDLFSAANLDEKDTDARANSLLSTKRHFEESPVENSSKMTNTTPFQHRSALNSLNTPSKSMYSTQSVTTSPPLQPAGSGRDVDQDQLVAVYARYLQAVYKASQGSRQFERQQAAAEVVFRIVKYVNLITPLHILTGT
jgi:hypothetical protein